MKLTPWFPAHIKPARPGVYETYSSGDAFYQHWNGKFWGVRCVLTENAARNASHISLACPHPKWRGLAEEPKA